MARPSSSASRGEVLSAAIELLRDKGHAALTVRAVAGAAGCSTMGVYTHFDGKAGLVDAIVADGHAGLAAALAGGAQLDAYGDPLVSVAMAYREWALAHPTQYQVMYQALVPDYVRSEATLAVAEAGYRAHVDRVRDALGADAATAERAARHLWWAIHGHVHFELQSPDAEGARAREADFLEAARWLRKGVEQ